MGTPQPSTIIVHVAIQFAQSHRRINIILTPKKSNRLRLSLTTWKLLCHLPIHRFYLSTYASKCIWVGEGVVAHTLSLSRKSQQKHPLSQPPYYTRILLLHTLIYHG